MLGPAEATRLRESVFYLADFLSSVDTRTIGGQACPEIVTALLRFLERTRCLPSHLSVLPRLTKLPASGHMIFLYADLQRNNYSITAS